MVVFLSWLGLVFKMLADSWIRKFRVIQPAIKYADTCSGEGEA